MLKRILVMAVLGTIAVTLSGLIPKAHAGPEGSNVYLGLGDDGGIDNSRRAWTNTEISSRTIRNSGLHLDCVFNVTSVFSGVNPDDPVFSRIVGPLATPQVDEDTVYFNVGAGWTRADFVPPEALNASKIVALDREDCTVKWVADYDGIADQSLLMLAAKYPAEYDLEAIQQYIANGGRAASGFIGSFAPISVFGDYIVTGDSTTSSEVLADDYLSGDVAQGDIPDEYAGGTDFNGQPYVSPLLGKEWGMRNDNPHGNANARRHLLRNAIMLLDKRTGALLAVDRYADSGELAADGVVNAGAALRMATPYVDPIDGNSYIIAGCSQTSALYPYTAFDNDKGRIDIGIANGNIRTGKGGRVTKFRIDEGAGGANLSEVWRFYTVPDLLEKGDTNPYTGEEFETAYEADQYNYGFDGVWGQRPIVDLSRRQVCFATGNGKQMPVEDIKLGRSAAIATSPDSHPEWSWQTWVEHFNAAAHKDTGSAEALAKAFDDYRITQEDTRNALNTVTATRPFEAVQRYKQYLANSISCVGLDAGEFRWTYRRTPLDTWTTQIRTAALSPCGLDATCLNDLYPDFIKWQNVGLGGDIDFGQGPIHVKDRGSDIYVALGKDGSMQGLDPNTGNVMWYTQVGHPTLLGGMNYGATTDGKSVFANVINLKQYQGSSLLLEGVVENGEPKLEVRPEAFAGVFNHDGWYTQDFYDTFNDLGGGVSKHYVNQNVLIPTGTSYIAKVDASNGRLRGIGPAHPFVNEGTFAEVLAVGDMANHPITSTNDVLLAVGGNRTGRFYVFSAKNFEKLWDYDAEADTAAIMPPGNDPLSTQEFHTGVVAPMVPAGKDIFVGAGETGFLGNFPGKFFYKFSIGEKNSETGNPKTLPWWEE
jgi:hypothetical protein